MRYNDVRDGTNVAGEVIEKYRKAWDKKAWSLLMDCTLIGYISIKTRL